MTTRNTFALLGDDDNDDPAALIARASALPVKKQNQEDAPAKLPYKPLALNQPARESENGGGRGRGGRGRGGRAIFGNRGRGGGDHVNGDSNEFPKEENTEEPRDSYFDGGRGRFRGRGRGFSDGDGRPRFGQNGDSNEFPKEESTEGARIYYFDGGRGRFRGRGRGFSDGDGRPLFGQREYERRSGTGRGSAIKREGTGRGNWGAEVEEPAIQEAAVSNVVEEEKPAEETPSASDEIQEKKKNEDETDGNSGEKKEAPEEEDKEMTLEEYEKVLMEKRKALDALKATERKVEIDMAFNSMRMVDKKNDGNEVFLKLGAEKSKKKEILDKEEKVRKSVSINEFLKPTNGEGFYNQSQRRGRGGGRGGGFRGGFGGGYSSNSSRESSMIAPRIEDPSQFPTLGAK